MNQIQNKELLICASKLLNAIYKKDALINRDPNIRLPDDAVAFLSRPEIIEILNN